MNALEGEGGIALTAFVAQVMRVSGEVALQGASRTIDPHANRTLVGVSYVRLMALQTLQRSKCITAGETLIGPVS